MSKALPVQAYCPQYGTSDSTVVPGLARGVVWKQADPGEIDGSPSRQNGLAPGPVRDLVSKNSVEGLGDGVVVKGTHCYLRGPD